MKACLRYKIAGAILWIITIAVAMYACILAHQGATDAAKLPTVEIHTQANP